MLIWVQEKLLNVKNAAMRLFIAIQFDENILDAFRIRFG